MALRFSRLTRISRVALRVCRSFFTKSLEASNQGVQRTARNRAAADPHCCATFTIGPSPSGSRAAAPYHKNDQAHVEQTSVISVRLSSPKSVEPNFFLPTMRLLSKTRDGGHLHRRHSKPCTPFQKNEPQRPETQRNALVGGSVLLLHDFLFFERGFRGSESRLSV